MAQIRYNHSTFVDLIISILVGLRAAASQTLTLNPMIGAATQYFALDNLRYHGRDVAIAFDRTGSGRYAGCEKGLCLFVDGKMVASRPMLGLLQYQLPAAAAPS
jgi:hypothetical protein